MIIKQIEAIHRLRSLPEAALDELLQIMDELEEFYSDRALSPPPPPVIIKGVLREAVVSPPIILDSDYD